MVVVSNDLHWNPCVEHLTTRLDALEELVLNQHDIIGVLIKEGQNVQKMLEEEE